MLEKDCLLIKELEIIVVLLPFFTVYHIIMMMNILLIMLLYWGCWLVRLKATVRL
ncbi:MAG: hypothetical protein ACLSU6_17080 [Thomasclavelia ramosa]|uniref:hypothetical protein n=1 Tax=Thomasclavelia ramosa TaxID=1547 RepID=UPI001D93594C|nr:hypothetical protein [Thomasclavelia ramosa]MBV4094280.1 hypothetical protein [Thomasclavelia ramosa]MBV4108825.1 hypothetical protein [Thomasclavelia ramosa]